MRTPTTARAAAAALLGALAAACADDATAPAAPRAGVPLAAGATSQATPQIASQSAAQAADTARPSAFPSAVRVRGRVLATLWVPGRTGADTLSGFEPVAGARVTLFRNVLVDGKGVSQRIGEQRTGADGAFQFDDVPGGPYVISLNVTPERPYGEALTYLLGNAAEVSTTLRVWRRATPPADSTGGS